MSKMGKNGMNVLKFRWPLAAAVAADVIEVCYDVESFL
jgi:hypothetical protein